MKKAGEGLSPLEMFYKYYIELYRYVRYSSDWINDPHILQWQGKQWITITEGHVLILLPPDNRYTEMPEQGKASCAKVLSVESVPIGKINFSALVEWCGKAQWIIDCVDCKAEDCENCDGDGWYHPDKTYGIINDLVYARDILARALALVPQDNAVIELRQADKMISIVADNWQLRIMAMNLLAEKVRADYLPDGEEMPVLKYERI